MRSRSGCRGPARASPASPRRRQPSGTRTSSDDAARGRLGDHASTRVADDRRQVDRRRVAASRRRPARAPGARRPAARGASTSARAASRSAASRPPRRPARGSRAAGCRAASGVRSWWEASATNSFCERSRVSSRATVSLNSAASARTSGGPLSAGARAWRSPAADGGGSPLERRERLRQRAGEAQPDDGRGREDDAADRGEQQPVPAHPRVERRGRIGDAHGAPDAPAGGDRNGDVDQVGPERVRVAGPGGDVPLERGGELGPARERAPPGERGVACRAGPARSPSTTTTRPPGFRW